MKKALCLALSLALLLSMTGCAKKKPVREPPTNDASELPEEDGAFPFQDSEGYWIMKVENPLSEYQLSEEQLAAPTEELLEDVLDSPCLFGLAATHYSFYCEPYEIYKSVRRTFNGLAELEKRADAASVMLARLTELVAEDRFSEGPFFGYVYYLQALLDVPVFYEKLTASEVTAYEQAHDAYIAYRDAEAAADNGTSNLEDYAVILKAVDHYSEHQLSEEQLAAPAEELVEDVLDFPFLLDITVSNSIGRDTPYPAYDSVRNAFNGLAELEKRADASSVMVAKLTELVTFADLSESPAHEDVYFLQMLLAVPVFYEKLTESEVIAYAQACDACHDV